MYAIFKMLDMGQWDDSLRERKPTRWALPLPQRTAGESPGCSAGEGSLVQIGALRELSRWGRESKRPRWLELRAQSIRDVRAHGGPWRSAEGSLSVFSRELISASTWENCLNLRERTRPRELVGAGVASAHTRLGRVRVTISTSQTKKLINSHGTGERT